MRRVRSRGQTLVEFALVLPIFLALLFGMLDLGRVVWANDALANAAREGARFAIVHGGSDNTKCPVGPGVTTAAGCSANGDGKEPIRTAAKAFAVAGGTNLTIEVCYGLGCVGNTDLAGATNVRSTPVTVTVRATVPILTGSLLGFDDYQTTGTSTMLVNN